MIPKIKFFLSCNEEKSQYHYFHNCVGLAEGFKELGILFGGNINYWQEQDTSNFLIERVPNDFNETINIFSIYYFHEDFSRLSSINSEKINILIDSDDGVSISCYMPEFRKFNFILRSHYHRKQGYPENVKPWAFGLTNRIIQELRKTESMQPEDRVLSNFRHDHNIRRIAVKRMSATLEKKYNIYEKISKEVSPTDKLFNSQTQDKHHNDYFQNLNLLW